MRVVFGVLVVMCICAVAESSTKVIVAPQQGLDHAGCGDAASPCKTLGFAATQAAPDETESLVVVMKDGTYSGTGQCFLNITFGDNVMASSLEFQAAPNAKSVVVDCERGGHWLWATVSTDMFAAYALTFNGSLVATTLRTSDSAIRATSSISLLVDGWTFEDCHVQRPDGGGALYLSTGNALETTYCAIANSRFHNCSAPNGEGGAIYAKNGQNVETAILRCNFTSNHARVGGSVFNAGTLNINVAFSHFHGSTATIAGGAYASNVVLPPSTPTHIAMSTFTGNKARIGGALFATGAFANWTDLEIHGNRAMLYGGGVFITNIEAAKIARSTLTGNTAGMGGAGIYAAMSDVVVVEHCGVHGNTVLSQPTSTVGGVAVVAITEAAAFPWTQVTNTATLGRGDITNFTSVTVSAITASAGYEAEIWCDRATSLHSCAVCHAGDCATCAHWDAGCAANSGEAQCLTMRVSDPTIDGVSHAVCSCAVDGCSDHGTCWWNMHKSSGACRCASGWIGSDCNIPMWLIWVCVGVGVGLLFAVILAIGGYKVLHKRMRRSYHEIN